MLSSLKIPILNYNQIWKYKELKPIAKYLKLLRKYLNKNDILGRNDIMKKLSYLETLMIVPKKYLAPWSTLNMYETFVFHKIKDIKP